MNNILVLVDFTPTSKIALDQAIEAAKLNNASIEIFHVTGSADEENSDEFQSMLAPYKDALGNSGLDHKMTFKPGKFQSVVSDHIKNRRKC